MRTKRQIMGDVLFSIHTPLKITGVQTLKFLLVPFAKWNVKGSFFRHLWNIGPKGPNFVDFFEEKIWTTLFENLSSLGPGDGYFSNFWVGTCRWDPWTLTLYQTSFKWILLPFTRLNSQNPPYPRVAVFRKLLRAQTQSSQNKTIWFFYIFEGNSWFS